MNIHQSGVTIKEAARVLGVSEAAVRQRLLRRTLSSTRQNGRVFVLLPEDIDVDPVEGISSQSDDTSNDTVSESDDTTSPPLISQLRSENSLLREQLIIKDRQISELHVMLQTAQRQLPATVPDAPHQEPSGQHERSGDDESRVASAETPYSAPQQAEQAAEKPQRWPWWMRILAGK